MREPVPRRGLVPEARHAQEPQAVQAPARVRMPQRAEEAGPRPLGGVPAVHADDGEGAQVEVAEAAQGGAGAGAGEEGGGGVVDGGLGGPDEGGHVRPDDDAVVPEEDAARLRAERAAHEEQRRGRPPPAPPAAVAGRQLVPGHRVPAHLARRREQVRALQDLQPHLGGERVEVERPRGGGSGPGFGGAFTHRRGGGRGEVDAAGALMKVGIGNLV